MTKAQIDAKRQAVINTCRAQITLMHKILKEFGKIPGIANDGDANILINTILQRIDASERDIKVFQMKSDEYIERCDTKDYLDYVQGKIDFFKSRLEFYGFNASLRHKDYEGPSL